MTHTGRFTCATTGHTQVLDITDDVRQHVHESGVRDGIVVAFVVGSTAGITTTEAEPGLVQYDLKAFYERIAPTSERYLHEETWHDDNGHAHVRASALGPSVAIPLVDGELTLGTWQQIVLLDFDTRPRQRTIIVQVVGE